MNLHIIALMAIVASAAGCATPPVALQNANHGLALSKQLADELARYTALQGGVDSLRKQTIAQENITAQDWLQNISSDEHLFSISGQTHLSEAVKNLRTLVRMSAAASANKESDLHRLQLEMGAVASPLPAVDESLDLTGKAFGALGTQLSLSERAAIAAAFVKHVNDEIKTSRAAAEAATANVITATPALTDPKK